jgi:hypothetical protein
MKTRTSAFDDGPFELLHKIVGAYATEGGADRRATVTVHTAGSKSWTGVPTQFVSNRSGEFFVFSFKDKPQSLALSAQQIVAVEIDDVTALNAFLAKPWTSDPDFAVVSKLQALRDLATLWGDASPKPAVQFDTFPATDDAPGFALAWVKRLKVELEKIREEFGDKELSAIKVIDLKYAAGPMMCTKQGDSIHFTIDISTESLDRKTIMSKISDVL